MVERYFKLSDLPLKDSLTSLLFVGDSGNPNGVTPIVVGGVAIQIHAESYRALLRRTPDLDLLLPDNIEYEEFIQKVTPRPMEFLKSEGYQVQTKRGRLNNTLKVMRNQNKPNAEELLVHFMQFSPNVWNDFKDYVANQIKFSRQMTYSATGEKVQTVALEELIPLKLQRTIKYGSNRSDLVGPVYSSLIMHAIRGNWGHLAGMPIGDWKETIHKMQSEAGIDDPLKLERVSTYKLSKDIYDLCLAARVINDSLSTFDKDRYEQNVKRIIERRSPQIAL